MSTIFISHSSKDNKAARELERRLAEKNHTSVFLDFDPEKGIVGGQSWEQTLYRKLRGCRAVIVLCTDSYVSSCWCFAEIALARMEGKQILALKVDPLSPDAKLPSILTDKQFIDLRTNKAEGYERLWNGLAEMDLLGVSNEWNPKESPYLGLNTYDEKHAPVFFGRDGETRAGIELLDRGAPGLIMVLGASGSGKSSIVRAGMVPRLRKDEDRWLVVGPFRSRTAPFAELAESLIEAYRRYAPEEAESDEIRDRIRDLRDAGPDSWLEAGSATDEGDLAENPVADERIPPVKPISLVETADHLRRVSGHRDAHLLLVIDQFEELLSQEDSRDNANRFLTLVRTAIETEHSSIIVLSTMRSDFLGVFQSNAALRNIDFETLSIGPMSVDGMRRAIEKPAELGAIELETGLADRLLQDTETPDALPLLSFTLSLLWRDYRSDGRLTVNEYENLGGLQGAISTEADAILKSARKGGNEDDIRRAFLKMARLTEDGSYAKLPVSWDRKEIRKVQPILEEFERRRLLVKRMDTVEVAHEALFRSWAPLKAWLDDHRSELLLAEQLRRDAQAWKENNFTAENLWHGGRLQQTDELMREGQLGGGVEEEFVRAGIRRRRIVRGIAIGVAFWVFAVLSILLVISRDAQLTAEASETNARRLNYVANMNLADQAFNTGEIGRSNELLDLFLPTTRPEQDDLRSFFWYYLWHNNHTELATLRGHSSSVSSVSFSPDGKTLASASFDNSVKLWDTGTFQELATLKGHSQGVTSLAFAPDGKTLASAGQDSTVKLWDTGTFQELATLKGHSQGVTSLAFTPDGKTLASAGQDSTVKIFDTGTWKEMATLNGHRLEVNSLAFSPDGKTLASAGQDSTVKIFDTGTWKEMATLSGHRLGVNSLAFSPDGKTLASVAMEYTVKLWDTAAWQELAALKRHSEGIFAVAFSPDGKTLASASKDTIKLWDTGSRQELATLKGHSQLVTSLAFSPDGKTLASAGWDSTVKLWDTVTRQELTALKGHSQGVISVAFSPDGKTLASNSWENEVKLWDTGTRQELSTFIGHSQSVLAVAFSPDVKTFAAASEDNTVKLWDIATRQDLATFIGHSEGIYEFAFSPDGKTLASASGDTIKLWDIASRQELATFIGHSEAILLVAFSPDGKTLASASKDTIKLWDIASRQELATLKGHSQLVTSLAFSPDGKKLASAGWDNRVTLWDTGTRQEMATFIGHSKAILAVAFSPDGKTLATASLDSTVKLWDTVTRWELATLKGHSDKVTSVAFSPDGKMLASGSWDNTVRLWIAATDQDVAAQRSN